MQQQTIINNNTRGPITIVASRKLSTKPGPCDLGYGMPDFGGPSFIVQTVTLKPGSNALTATDARVVAEQRDKNPLVKARFERLVTKGRGNEGHPELEEAGKSRHHLERAIRECSDPETLRKYRDAFASDKSLAEIVNDQLAKTTVTAEGVPVAHDVKRDPADPRKGAR